MTDLPSKEEMGIEIENIMDRFGVDDVYIEDDEDGIVVAEFADGSVEIEPSDAILHGEEIKAARVVGNFRRQTGARLTEVREVLRNAGYYAQ